jgi:squalene-hopene/tetraprenyl-beta-curcumene cyclase
MPMVVEASGTYDDAIQPVAQVNSASRASSVALAQSVSRGVEYLKAQQKNGSWMSHPGITALCLRALVKASDEITPSTPWIEQGFAYLLSCQREDGAFVDPNARMQTTNYSTALAILALVERDDAKSKKAVQKGQAFLVEMQADEGEGYELEHDMGYGGIGYGGDERPDLSNLQLALEALKASGLPDDHPAYQKALIFLKRCQDIEGNTMEWAGASGGFAYAPDASSNQALPANRGASQEVAPYGSMTFAGLKSLLFCNVEKSDPRVKEAMVWISNNFSVSEHPNFGQNSIYYYFKTMSKALEVADVDVLTLADGQTVDWRDALVAELIKRQGEDGSWVNSAKRYMEGVPVLVTSYALSALNAVDASRAE